ncbi:hypothetical protein LSUE1_G003614 [Lachnellula suecica]|uniref:Uncharacterized protein n=1 Tax=Lachnellula suecica TaxID=602035 RepID=A0A8T9CBC0_9HELO|nr:hypothetical protein LSUE1_G003614 [Lachnellula suecica]
MPLADVVLLNASYDLSLVYETSTQEQTAGGFTSMAYIHEPNANDEEPQSVFISRNWNISPRLFNDNTIIIIEIRNSEAGTIFAPKTILSLTEADQLARSGINSCGIASCPNSLWSSEDSKNTLPELKTKATLPFTLARLMFLECGNYAASPRTLVLFPPQPLRKRDGWLQRWNGH